MSSNVINLEDRKSAKLERLAPPIVYGSVELDGDRIRLIADTRLTEYAAERLAGELWRLAQMLRDAR